MSQDREQNGGKDRDDCDDDEKLDKRKASANMIYESSLGSVASRTGSTSDNSDFSEPTAKKHRSRRIYLSN